MTDIPMKHYWNGQDIETLSREELIEAVKILGNEAQIARDTLSATISIYRAAQSARGLRQ